MKSHIPIIHFGHLYFGLCYINRLCISTAGIQFPKPFVLQIDNDAARIFAMDTCFRSRMKHIAIDCAQEWVRILRDKQIIIMSTYTCQLQH